MILTRDELRNKEIITFCLKKVGWTSTRSERALIISPANPTRLWLIISPSDRRIRGITIINCKVSDVSNWERREQTVRQASTWINGWSCSRRLCWKTARRLGKSSLSVTAK